MKKRILIHTLIFPPDQVSTSYLYGDIVQRLIREGFDVTVITTFPHYNYGGDFKKVSTGLLWRKTDYYGATVYHFPQKKSGSMFVRGVNILTFHLAAFFKGLFARKFDLIITPSPPLTSGLIGGLIGKIRGARIVYNVQEIYPDVFIKQGAVKNQWMIAFFRWLEKLTYRLSDKVVTIDDHFSRTLKDRVHPSKLECIPNFIDTELYQPYFGIYPEDLDFAGKYLIGYVGNLGKVQDWDALIKAAELIESDSAYHFLFVGGGSEFKRLKSAERQLSNVTVWPYQERSRIPSINSRIDLHVISMNEASDYDGLPSKVFAILSCGRPILAATNRDTPLARLLERSGNGVVVARNNGQAIADAAVEIAKGKLPDGSNQRGRDFVLKNFSKEVITSKYVDLVYQLT